MRLRGMADEELASARFRTVGGDAHGPAPEVERRVLVGQRPAGAALAVSARIAALDHEIRNDAMPGQRAVESARGQRRDGGGGERRLAVAGAKLERQVAGGGPEAQHPRAWR